MLNSIGDDIYAGCSVVVTIEAVVIGVVLMVVVIAVAVVLLWLWQLWW